ncbi:MAG: Mannose-1-phosphate guanylyltransferase [Candidatus Magasanikbacteria bacterium GW2011_GWA2_46_17]|uniref:Mannose-1-phosphate guanylyltransferase n=1 Tax=Candidatus Magasanikbacteria bacterium GW2011_GWA2_46_17 TaxID=1619042 RepID=A0A0G1P3S5_9BACT|nr:MAG: Mannose-1-phosphate guanylyltransferase [Candidatus Magasanikbacteria bacterium GW2011_GWA2_46_17]
MKCIILCGGVGKRLWPLGRRSRPKQFHTLLNEKTLLQETYARLRKHFSMDDIFISTSRDFVEEIKREIPAVPADHYSIEPARRDTAAAMGYAARFLFRFAPQEPCVFVPSDHYIDDAVRFCKTLTVGEKLIREYGVMVDIGVPPTAPLTSLGYTRIGKRLKTIDGIAVYQFEGHTEKPNKSVAARYMNAKNYLWHANYYMWTPEKFLNALKRYVPAVYNGLSSISAYKRIKPISFDYAVTEKMDSDDVLILKAPFAWSDVGSWSEVWSVHPAKTKQGNVVHGNVYALNSRDNMILSSGKRLVAVTNVHNMIIVDTNDALLVCPQSYAQEVKKIVDYLEKRGGQFI